MQKRVVVAIGPPQVCVKRKAFELREGLEEALGEADEARASLLVARLDAAARRDRSRRSRPRGSGCRR